MQVHKEPVPAIPNSLPNRGDPEIEIYGMEGIPDKDVKERRKKLAQIAQRGGEIGDDDDDNEIGMLSFRMIYEIRIVVDRESFNNPFYKYRYFFITCT